MTVELSNVIMKEMSINKQIENILRNGGGARENEVIQSFVRSDLENDGDEIERGDASKTSKDKKTTKYIADMEMSLSKVNSGDKYGKDADVKSKRPAPIYQHLGMDAMTYPAKNNAAGRKNDAKWNRRQRIIEEVYTDKDRAAAVSLGTRDIKQSLKLKRRQDRTRILEISEEAHPGTLLTLALHRFKNGDVRVALKFVNKALELNQYDIHALVARSKCYLFLGNPTLALQDAERALTENKTFIKALYQKAEALYHLAQFEYSLMYFHKGLHIRSQMEHFKRGVFKSQQAILNSIGKKVPNFTKILSYRKRCPDVTSLTDLASLTIQHDHFRNDLSSSKLLNELNEDKTYLENLMKNPAATNVDENAEKETRILVEAKEEVLYLENRRLFWKQQKSLVQKHVKSSSTRNSHKNGRRLRTQNK